MKSRARRSILRITPLALVVFVATAAWACTAVPSVSSGLRSGPAGMHVPLDGTGFAPADVEIRWNAPDGPIVGAAMGPDFSTTFTVPEASPGIYYVVALQKGPDGSVIGKASDTFELTGPADSPAGVIGSSEGRSASASSAGLWEGFSNIQGSSPDRIAPPADTVPSGPSPAFLIGLGLVTAGAGALTAGLVTSKRATRRSNTA